MTVSLAKPPSPIPAVKRLAALSPLDPEAEAMLAQAARRGRTVRARQEILRERQPISEAVLLLEGWAARARHLADGRRQILGFVLPGEFAGLCDHEAPLASSTVFAITDVRLCAAPARGSSPTLDRAYARSRAIDEAYLIAQITRLGRLNAYERLCDLLLELLERLEPAGLASDGRFTLPLTQELIADALGLTSVHVNRTLQAARRDGDIISNGREVTIVNPALLGDRTGRGQTRAWRD